MHAGLPKGLSHAAVHGSTQAGLEHLLMRSAVRTMQGGKSYPECADRQKICELPTADKIQCSTSVPARVNDRNHLGYNPTFT